MEKERVTASKPEKKVENDTETSTKLVEKTRTRKRKRPPINPNYKPTTVNIDDLRNRLRAESREVLRRAGIWLD